MSLIVQVPTSYVTIGREFRTLVQKLEDYEARLIGTPGKSKPVGHATLSTWANQGPSALLKFIRHLWHGLRDCPGISQLLDPDAADMTFRRGNDGHFMKIIDGMCDCM